MRQTRPESPLTDVRHFVIIDVTVAMVMMSITSLMTSLTAAIAAAAAALRLVLVLVLWLPGRWRQWAWSGSRPVTLTFVGTTRNINISPMTVVCRNKYASQQNCTCTKTERNNYKTCLFEFFFIPSWYTVFTRNATHCATLSVRHDKTVKLCSRLWQTDRQTDKRYLSIFAERGVL